MWCNLLQVAAQLLIVMAFAQCGIEAMVVAYTALSVLFIGVWQWFLRRIAGIRAVEIFKDTAPFLLVSAVVMAAVYWLTLPIGSLLLRFAAHVVAAAVLYAGVMKVMRAAILDECIGFFAAKFKRH